MNRHDDVPPNPRAQEIAQHLISAWEWRLGARGSSAETIRRNLMTVEALLNYSGKLPWDLKERDLLGWAAHLVQVRGLRASSVEASLKMACSFLKYLANSRHVKRHLHGTLGIGAKKLDDLGRMRVVRSQRAIDRSRREMSPGYYHQCSTTEAYTHAPLSAIPELTALIEKALTSKPGAPDDND